MGTAKSKEVWVKNWTMPGSSYCPIPEEEFDPGKMTLMDPQPLAGWRIALACAIGLAVITLIVVLIMWAVAILEDPPAQSPPAETVEVETQMKADPGDPATWETPPVIEPIGSGLSPSDEVEETEVAYEAAWLPEQDYWDTVTGIQGYMAHYWLAGFDPEIDIYMGWKEKDPRGWANLVRWGRGEEEPPGPLPPPMEIACKLAACAENIDGLLASRGSPLAGYGREFARAGYDWGVNPYLLVGLAGKESSFATDGSYWRTNHNAWGMLGSCPGVERRNGACWWPDWPTAIDGAAYFVAHYWPGAWTAYDCRGYCVGNPSSWTSTVEAIRSQLGGAPW